LRLRTDFYPQLLSLGPPLDPAGVDRDFHETGTASDRRDNAALCDRLSG